MTSERIKKSTAVLLMMLLLASLVPQAYIFAGNSSTNENIAYRYLVNTMGLNTAAACGVLANIQCESEFVPTTVGDQGTSYGICQWHYCRWTNLTTYCETNGYDSTSIEGQLHYLEYELKKDYKNVYNYLKSVSNDADGAYNAGYYWCYHFEIPKNYPTVSVNRGNLAKNTYWPAYKKSGTSTPAVSKDPNTYKVSYSRVLKLTDGTYMVGNDVKYVQVCLQYIGYSIDVDGWYGPNTAAVVTQFQKDYGLTVDGVCGAGTWNKLESAVSTNGGTLSIVTQPTDSAAKIGGEVKFTVKAEGDGLKYQWQLSDDAGKTWRNSSVTEAYYSATLTQANVNRRVRCVITDRYGNKVTSNTATMKLTSLAITKQPTDSAVKLGETVKFTVAASGDGLKYQWQLSDDAGKTWRSSSVTEAYYSATLTEANNGRYVRCVVTDKNGGKVTSNSAVMRVSTLTITKQPTDSTVKLGQMVKFTVAASGSSPSYQWQLSDDAGKTWRNSSVTETYYSTTLTEANNGRYVRCVVTDKNGGKVISKSAVMKASEAVKPATTALAITKQPANCTVNAGGQVIFTVTASGSGLSYQWQLSDDAGKTWRSSSVKTSYYVTTLTQSNNGRYVRCIITDKNGSKVTSSAAVMKAK